MRERWARRILATVAAVAVGLPAVSACSQEQEEQDPHKIVTTLGIGKSLADTKKALNLDCKITDVGISTTGDGRVTIRTEEPNCKTQPNPPQGQRIGPSTVTRRAHNVAVIERGTGTNREEADARALIDPQLQQACGEPLKSVPLQFTTSGYSFGDVVLFSNACVVPLVLNPSASPTAAG